MKRTIKSIAGVTLLEIMLVLAIAAMIITMSIKYYQTANNTAHINSAIEQVNAIAAAADSIGQASGSYSAVTSAALGTALPTAWNFTPWGSTIKVTTSSNTLSISMPAVPPEICANLTQRITANQHFTTATTCTVSGSPSVLSLYYTP